MRILKALDEVSQAASATQAQVALAWLLQRPAIAAPIVSATSTAQLSDILKAASVTLDKTAVAKLDSASAA
jgi:aryl-alcohol dehydrogenase-like predicted oxidoreductase